MDQVRPKSVAENSRNLNKFISIDNENSKIAKDNMLSPTHVFQRKPVTTI